MGSALRVVQGFFPLDDELGLLPGCLSPHLQEQLAHLCTWVASFSKAVELWAGFTGAVVSERTARRETEAAGAAYAAVQLAEVERIEKVLPTSPPGPEKQLLSVDGCMVPLVHGEWGEVKTAAIGVIEEPVMEKGEWVVHAGQLSYFSRLADSDTFGRLALVETHRRGVEKAGKVAAVADGAAWEQAFFDLHRPDAERILDFTHAKDYVKEMGEVLYGQETPEAKAWLGRMLHSLKHDGPARVLADLETLTQGHSDLPVLADNLAYLKKREQHMQYPAYQAQGLPIGSGAVESSHTVVVEARLKGAGMHWARGHVNPMLALRNAACSDRWDEAWSEIADHLRSNEAQRRLQRQERHRSAKAAAPRYVQGPLFPSAQSTHPAALPAANEPLSITASPLPADPSSVQSTNLCEQRVAASPSKAPPVRTHQQVSCRPAADHPWRRPFLKRTNRFLPASAQTART